MRSRLTLHAVDSHTEGMPTRVIVGGVGVIPGNTMAERRHYFMQNMDHLRRLLMFEPRGHSAMSGAILQPSTRPDCQFGVLYIEVSGCLPMCGHGTIGVATVLVETGMVDVIEPITEIHLDTPAGPVIATVLVENGAARAVTIRNVASFAVGLDLTVVVPGLGEVSYDMAFGGNFYAMIEMDDIGLKFDRSQQQAILQAGLAVMDAINSSDRPVHPLDQNISGCHHVQFVAPGSTPQHSRHAMAIYPGWFDRSPCGTGTSARMAQLFARGQLGLDQDFVNESFIGTRFTGRLVEKTDVAGVEAVVPTITGRAWLTATSQFHLDPDDPFPAGFEF